MTAYLVNHLRQPGVVKPEVLDYLEKVQATLDPFEGRFIAQGGKMELLEGAWATDNVVGDRVLLDGVAHEHTPGKFAKQIRELVAGTS